MNKASARRERILDVAVLLAEQDGYDNVRQRDVAERAGVALGTLYKSFRSKEDILSAALEREAAVLERELAASPARGATPTARVASLFRVFTRALCAKPNFGRAVLRAMASGEPEVAGNVAAYYGRLHGMVVAALRGKGALSADDPPATERETTLSFFLLQVWFAALVGWSARLCDEAGINAQIDEAARLFVRGMKRGG